jgi:integrase
VLRIIGKGNKERCVPLPEPMLAKLRRLWSTHRNPRWLTPDRSGLAVLERARQLGHLTSDDRQDIGLEIAALVDERANRLDGGREVNMALGRSA